MPNPEQIRHYFTTLNAQRIPRIMPVVNWLILITLTLVVAFMVFVPWVQTTSGFGAVTALNPNDRLQEINALVSGRIQEWYVRDGMHVQVGDPIVRVVDIDPRYIERLRSERGQVIAKLEASKAAQRTAEIDMRRTEDLFEDGLASRREYEQARIKVEELRSRVAEAAAELTRVDVNLSRQSEQIVRAPRNGVILRVNAGDAATFVNAGDIVATFVPDSVERAVEIFVNGRDVALVQKGDAVRLQFEGWPAVQFSGWPSKAVGTFSGLVTAVDPSAHQSGRFRILVIEDPDAPESWPGERFVRFGSGARGWVLLETVPVGYEIWRQLNNFPPNLPESGSNADPMASQGST